MGCLYAKGGKIYTNKYMEFYVPMEYFNVGMAYNKGISIETFGVVYVREFDKGNEGPIRLFNAPTVINLMLYEFEQEFITINNKSISVMTLKYLQDSCVMHQSVTKGRMIAEDFLALMLAGKLPSTLKYDQVIDTWWRNLEIAGINYKVPSKIYEMIIASIYRNPHNPKERYGQYYGRSNTATGYDYKTEKVKDVVKDLSTFSGMVFEDIGLMISNGINNSLDDIDEPISPLEKIIHY